LTELFLDVGKSVGIGWDIFGPSKIRGYWWGYFLMLENPWLLAGIFLDLGKSVVICGLFLDLQKSVVICGDIFGPWCLVTPLYHYS